MDWLALSLLNLLCLSSAGCGRPLESEVQLATDLDKEVVGPILSAFYRAEQGKVQPQVRTSRDFEPLAGSSEDDVLWSSDLLAMERLSQQGKLQAIRWAPDRLLSVQYSSPEQTWQACVAAAMVIVVHRDLSAEAKQSIDSVDDLADPKWQQRCAIADPAKSQATLLTLASIALSKPADQSPVWLQHVQQQAVILEGELAVLTQVERGAMDWGLVRSDLVAERMDHASKFEVIFPDQQAAQPGTVLIPYAVAVKADAAHPVAAGRLANYLASPPTAERLAMGEPALIPLSTLANTRPRILQDRVIRWAKVDYKSLQTGCDQVRAVFAQMSRSPESQSHDQ